MTPDHRVLCNGTWLPAEQACGLHNVALLYYPDATTETATYGKNIHPPYRDRAERDGRKEVAVEGQMRLREHGNQTRSRPCEGVRENMRSRLPSVEAGHVEDPHPTRNVPPPGLRSLVVDESQVQPANTAVLPSLRSKGNSSDPRVGDLREVLGRHGTDLHPRTGLGPDRQQRGILKGQLPVDYSEGEQQKHAVHIPNSLRDAGKHAGHSCEQRNTAHHLVIPDTSRMARTGRHDNTTQAEQQPQTEEVYDLLDCGPRNRFVIRGGDDKPALVVHNCAQATARDLLADAAVRLEEAGVPVVLHVHDEIIAEVDKDSAEDALHEVERHMQSAPDWAEGLPVGVEAHILERYGK